MSPICIFASSSYVSLFSVGCFVCSYGVLFFVFQTKVVNETVINRYDFSSYSIKYFWEILKSLSNRRKAVISNFGFSFLLLFQKCEIPSAFVRWIDSSVDTVSSQILVDDCKIIPISKESVYYVTGLPKSGDRHCRSSTFEYLITLVGVSHSFHFHYLRFIVSNSLFPSVIHLFIFHYLHFHLSKYVDCFIILVSFSVFITSSFNSV